MRKRDGTKILIGILAVALVSAVAFPVFAQAKGGGRKGDPRLYAMRRRMHNRQVLSTFKRGASDMEEVNTTVERLRSDDPIRLEFAKALHDRGQTGLAFRVERTRVHSLGWKLPSDSELTFYMALAKSRLEPAEVSWAKAHIGPAAHYDSWRKGPGEALIARKPYLIRDGIYEETVNEEIAQAVKELPDCKVRLEAFQRNLLQQG